MAEKESNQRHKSTIDKYFGRTTKAYKAWVEDNEGKRNFLQIAVEENGEVSEGGNKCFDFHIAYSLKTDLLGSGLAQAMERNEDIRQLILAAAKMYYIVNIKIKDNETDNQI